MIQPARLPSAEEVLKAFKAIEQGNERAIQTLLYLAPESFHEVRHPNGSGATLVHAATERNELSILSLLLKKNFRVDVNDDNGRNPLHLALTANAAMMLLSAAKHHAPAMLLEQDFDGNIPYHAAAQRSNTHTLAYLLRVAPSLPAVLLRKNRQGDTVVHELARHTPSLLPSMVSMGLDVRGKNMAGETARDVCTTPKGKMLLGAHMVLKDQSENMAREDLLEQAKANEAIKAAEKALDFVRVASPPSPPSFSLKK